MRDQEYMKNLEWGYPVHYGKEKEYSYDVVVIGGGLSGCFAAIAAKKKGLNVAILDKGPIVRSGCAGTGIDHWHSVHTSPACTITPEEAVDEYMKLPLVGARFGFGHMRYIECMESYNILMDLEKWGLPIRDLDDEFEGAPFRDEKTKLLYAYNYDAKSVVRLRGGALLKPTIASEVQRLGIDVYEYVMGLRLLNEGGKSGGRVIGATAMSIRTGEFLIFKAKSVVACGGPTQGIWNAGTELNGASNRFLDPNCVGDVQTMVYKAGAEVSNFEFSNRGLSAGGYGYHPYSVGNVSNTWYGGRLVDAKGTLIHYLDEEGNILPEDRLNYGDKVAGVGSLEGRIERDVPERIRRGELVLPFYIDFPGMEPKERRALWGLMIGNEGKTNYSVYKMMNKWGFDPEKDMIQVPVFEPEGYLDYCFWNSVANAPKQLRRTAINGIVAITDWNLKTTLDGLYAAGYMLGNQLGAGACTTGQYAGRNAAEYAGKVEFSEPAREQIDSIKEEAYAPVTRENGTGWKDYKQGMARVMQDYCGEYKVDEVLETGLKVLKSQEESEGQQIYARNPHELCRAYECLNQQIQSQLTMLASLARKASWGYFKRLDHTDEDPAAWDKFITFRDVDGEPVQGEYPLEYWLKEPFASTYKENYEKNSAK